jgi:hypothetical protein
MFPSKFPLQFLVFTIFSYSFMLKTFLIGPLFALKIYLLIYLISIISTIVFSETLRIFNPPLLLLEIPSCTNLTLSAHELLSRLAQVHNNIGMYLQLNRHTFPSPRLLISKCREYTQRIFLRLCLYISVITNFAWWEYLEYQQQMYYKLNIYLCNKFYTKVK